MEIPIIDGLVMGVPERVSDAEMAADYRISSIESDLELSGNESLYGQGVSFIRPLTRSPFLDRQQHRYEAPWSVLKLFDQPYDDRFFSGVLQHDNIPDPVAFALKKLKMNSAPVAIFDTGMQAYHRYLWRIAESAVNVVEFVESDDIFKLKTETAFDDNGHGSHVAGIIGGILDPQHRWGAGANIDLYSVKVLGDDGMGFLSNIIYGLQWAIDNDIKIVNMSIAYRQDSPAVRRAIQESAKAGVIMLASAGNKSNYDPNITLKITADGGSADGGSADGGSADGGSADGGSADGGSADGGSADGGSADGDLNNALPKFSVMYPARYPEVIAVGASNAYGRLATFSNFGDEIDILAPGANILSVDITNGDAMKGLGITSGTSMAVPYVTAAVAMMLAVDPDMNSEEIREILTGTAHLMAGGSTVGDLNLVAALEEVIFRLGDNASRGDNSKKHYRKRLKAKIKAARRAALN
ncbi:S8 family serine peptidase [Desulfococcus multivorans]|uniref:S8 family serine peptidase n=1 Tax=Desulfococcus multivorans TaxID=897 RepID=UPI001471AA18|nr:S8 family serine peptidase [Desulfococcus multivorans]